VPAPLLARNGPAQQRPTAGEAEMAAAKRDGLHTFSELVSTGQVQNVPHVHCNFSVHLVCTEIPISNCVPVT
jgi:hypothetical protein